MLVLRYAEILPTLMNLRNMRSTSHEVDPDMGRRNYGILVSSANDGLCQITSSFEIPYTTIRKSQSTLLNIHLR
jgi:hypothetical protein